MSFFTQALKTTEVQTKLQRNMQNLIQQASDKH